MQLPIFILAAGASRRLGRAKQLVVIDGQSLIRRQCRVALDAAVGPAYVVLGCNAEACRAEVADLPVHVLMNEQWNEGLAASIRTAAATAIEAHADALLLMHVDQHALTAEGLRQLAAAWRSDLTRPHLSRDGDHLGPPAIIPAAYFSALMNIRGDHGARGVLGDVIEVTLLGASADLDIPSHLPRSN